MSKFYKTSSEHNQIDENDYGLNLQSVISLLDGSEFKDEMLALFNLDSTSKDIIPITGLKNLVNSIIYKDQEFIKFDLDVNLSNVSLRNFTDNDTAILDIQLTEQQKEYLDEENISVETVYNSKGDYFDSVTLPQFGLVFYRLI